MRRALALLLTLAAIAAAAAGCGSSSSGSALDDSLGYMPKSSLVVIAIKTNPDDAQFKNVSALIDKFPFASAIKDRIKQQLKVGGAGASYDNDIKPLLGNDLVVAVPPGGVQSGGLQATGSTGFVLAWKTKGGDIEKLVSKESRKVGSEEGATLYQSASGSTTAVKGKTIVAAKTRPLLDAALRARNASGRMTEADFNAALGDLSKDALVRIEGNLQTILASSPRSAKALRVPWVKGLRTFGATAATAADGISLDFQVKTAGVSVGQQPLAAGAAAPPVVKRPGEIGVGLRNPAQILKFLGQVAGAIDPKGLVAAKKRLDLVFNRNVIDQIGGNSAASFALDGGLALRADLKDPGKFKRTLAKVMRNFPKAQRAQGKPTSKVKSGPKGLYTVTRPGHKPQVVGVIGNELVIATDAARAKEFAAQSASPVPGTKGALVLTADPKSLVDAILKKQGNSGAALIIGPALSAHLESLNGSVESEAGGLRGTLKLTVR